jgi:hypothetical protein
MNKGKNVRMTVVLTILLLGSSSSLLPDQAKLTQPHVVTISASKSAPIPKFLVYRHFLAWANDLDNKSVAAGESDPYKFAKPFQRAHLETQDLDAVRKEAKALDTDLKKHGDKVKAVVAEYRRTAQKNVGQNSVLPPLPAEIHELEAMRTAILVQHMVSLQSALGPQKSAQLEAYLEREFTPHISLKPLVRPAASTAANIPTQPFTIGQQ